MGTGLEEGAVDAQELTLDKPTILVLGSEGFGMTPDVNKYVEHLCRGAARGCGLCCRSAILTITMPYCSFIARCAPNIVDRLRVVEIGSCRRVLCFLRVSVNSCFSGNAI